AIATRATDRNTLPPKRRVAYLDHILLGDRLPETRPARPRVKLRRRIEQRRIARWAAVEARHSGLVVRAAEGTLGACETHHVISIVAQALMPLRIVEHEFGHMTWPQLVTIVRKAHEQ